MTEPIRIQVGSAAGHSMADASRPVYLDDLNPKMRQRILLFEDLVHQLKRQVNLEPYYCWQCGNEDGAFVQGPDEAHEKDCPRQAARDAIKKAEAGL